jgi:hypothetical protein
MAKFIIAKEVLIDLYWEQKLSLSEIGKLYDVDAVTISNRMKEFEIKRRSGSDSLKGRSITWVDKISESNKGRTLDIHTRKKISETRKRLKFVSWNTGLTKFTNPDRVTYGMKSEKHWNWKGGISTEQNRFRQSSEYKTWRMSVFKRDNFICQECQQHTRTLEVHHIILFSESVSHRLDLNNGITLCKSCHRKKHKKGGIKNE